MENLYTYALVSLEDAKYYLNLVHDDKDDYLIENIINRATDILEQFLRRKVLSRTFTHERYDGGKEYVYLENFPVIAVERVSEGTIDAIRLKYTSTTEFNAYAVASATGIDLVVDGTHLASELLFATYTTLSTMAAAINSQSGWEASVPTSDREGYPSSLIFPQQNIFCLDEYGYLEIPDEPLDGLEVYERRGMLYRSSGFSAGNLNVFVTYTAGYSTTPRPLADACLQIVARMYNDIHRDPGVQSESWEGHSYTVKNISEMISSETLKQVYAMRRVLV